jgi:hypothetical protein
MPDYKFLPVRANPEIKALMIRISGQLMSKYQAMPLPSRNTYSLRKIMND